MKRGRNQRRRPSNNINRAMDSNGPDVRIRGTANQIYDKYLTLARDAQSAGDRVKAENYLQHAEHYFRLIRSIQASQPQQQGQQNQQQQSSGEGEQPVIAGGDAGDARRQRSEPRNGAANGRDREVAPSSDVETVKDAPAEEKAAEEETPKEAAAKDEAAKEAPKKTKRRTRRPTKKAVEAPAEDAKTESEPQAAE